MDAVALDTSDATKLVVDALGELPKAWTTDDMAEWVRSYLGCQRTHGPWALVWRAAARVDNEVIEIGRANRRYHAETIGKQLRGLGGDSETDPVYDGLIVMAILESLLADGHRVGGSGRSDRRRGRQGHRDAGMMRRSLLPVSLTNEAAPQHGGATTKAFRYLMP